MTFKHIYQKLAQKLALGLGVMTLGASLVGMVGCDQSTTNGGGMKANESLTPNDTKTTTAESNTTNHAKILKIAINTSMPPFVYLNDVGTPIGIDIDVIKSIGEKQGFGVEFFPMPWKNLFPSVEAGETDLAISGISFNADRNQKYGLTKSYLYVPSAIVYKTDNPKFKGKSVAKLEDLKGTKVGAMEVAKQMIQMETVGGKENSTYTDTSFLAFKKVLNNEIDATFEDRQLLEYYAKSYPKHKLKIVSYETKENPESQQVIMTKKSNQELLDKLNQGIDELVKSGELKRIEEKWLNAQ
ncbi:extracellular solute-binding protein [Moraxella macacae 0408225]|uniref:Extracellular solute-binding protein n=1 Tax=Moraxella macacae 0408225 TaxID=1230338 RepID=L2F607_9GAMM|nr:transporter substrate-binding domain-containing protein [Moraxella macacae]ELA08335.1 extracellular solute-binding protein [Moraxella macacae 0408225]